MKNKVEKIGRIYTETKLQETKGRILGNFSKCVTIFKLKPKFCSHMLEITFSDENAESGTKLVQAEIMLPHNTSITQDIVR